MINKKQKELIKIYVFMLLVVFVSANWDSVSWLFNYQEVSGLVYDFFNPYQQSNILVSAQNNNVPNYPVVNNNVPAKNIFPYSDKPNSLEIPKIGVTTAVVIGESTDLGVLKNDLDQGAVYYPGSPLPGEKGQIIILGHSAPPGWPKIKHDWIFSDVNNLNPGDEITLYFNNRQYTYSVVEKNIIKKGQDITLTASSLKSSVLTLVSCWPPGKDHQRIAVKAELKNN